ncbi:21 kDa protein-like [Dioscorea cayenensis subsp. rotundata]|uniref:21 kDa protein-like n=1 Tax=Dioscorea cayennensis subsp. rotundata TaxID=55577 RepID=A0AB40B5P4_DIOCR|nr:21 kDa protein-like [Dioscorea cayenensis subsp. rotundata]
MVHRKQEFLKKMASKMISSGMFTCNVLAVLLLFVFNSNTCNAARLPKSGMSTSTSVEFIRNSCTKTDYPTLCFSSLSAYAPTIQTSPKQLAEAALSVSLDNTRSTSAMIRSMSKGRGTSSREKEAMSDCMETLEDSVEELKQSLQAMGELRGKDVKLHMNDIQTWVSAALTDENTCMNGFTNNEIKDEGAENKVRSQVVKVAQLTSNALALINGMAGAQSSAP